MTASTPNPERHQHIVMMSSGVGSWAAAKRVVDRHGVDGVTLLFADVKGSNPSPHAGEDEDNYRFLAEAAENVGAPLVWLTEGRDIWEVFEDEGMLANNRAPICSKKLKQELTRAWVEENCDHTNTTIYLGLSWEEPQRFAGNVAGWAPWPVEYPMADEPWLDETQVFDWLHAEGIERPRLYDLGYAHANCGGFCVQQGQADAARLLRTNPERYRYHEEREAAFGEKRGKRVAFMVDRRHDRILAFHGLTEADVERRPTGTGGKPQWWVKSTNERLPGRVPLTMREFRLRLEADATLFDSDDFGPCACFPFAPTPPRADRSSIVNSGSGSPGTFSLRNDTRPRRAHLRRTRRPDTDVPRLAAP